MGRSKIRLNPFLIRATFKLRAEIEKFDFEGLNPFLIRATFKRRIGLKKARAQVLIPS